MLRLASLVALVVAARAATRTVELSGVQLDVAQARGQSCLQPGMELESVAALPDGVELVVSGEADVDRYALAQCLGVAAADGGRELLQFTNPNVYAFQLLLNVSIVDFNKHALWFNSAIEKAVFTIMAGTSSTSGTCYASMCPSYYSSQLYNSVSTGGSINNCATVPNLIEQQHIKLDNVTNPTTNLVSSNLTTVTILIEYPGSPFTSTTLNTCLNSLATSAGNFCTVLPGVLNTFWGTYDAQVATSVTCVPNSNVVVPTTGYTWTADPGVAR